MARTSTRWAVLAAAALFCLPRQGAAVQAPAYQVLAGGKASTLEALLDAAAQADVVAVGEDHDHAQGHALELAILQGLRAREPRLVLSLEMFERDVQLVVDEYLSGLITESAFVSASRPWPNYKTDYAPLVEFCRESRIPVLAANVPRRYVNVVSRRGQDALREVSRAARSYLPPLPVPMDLPPGYDRDLTELFAQQHGQMPAGTPGMPTVEHMKQAQALWDAGMADSILRCRRERRGTTIMHVNGAMHSDRGWGVVDRLRRADRRLKVLVVSIKRDPAYPSVDPGRYAGLADYVVVTPASTR